MTIDPALSSASSGLLLSTSTSTASFAPQPFQPFTSAHLSYSQQHPHHQPAYQQHSAAQSSSPQQIVSRLLEIERSLQYLTTTAYCHPILASGLNSQFYVIKYAMHALSAEEKKLSAWQQRRQRAMERRQKRAQVKREATVKSEEDEAGLSMRGEGETDPSLSMMIRSLQSHESDEAADEQQQEEEERRQSEMHELRVNKAELRHVGEWINAQLAALHSQVQTQMAHYPSPPSSPPPPPPPSSSTSTRTSHATNPHTGTQHHQRPTSASPSSGASHFGGPGPSSSSTFQSAPQYPTASTTSTGSAYPTYSAPTSYSLPPPPLDERSVSTGSRSSPSSPVSPPPASQPPPLISSQSLPVWSSSAANVSSFSHSTVYRKIDSHDFFDKSYVGSADMMDTSYMSAPLRATQLSSLPVSASSSVPLSRAEQLDHYPPHPASSQSLGASAHSSTVSRAAATVMYSGYTSHSQHFAPTSYLEEGSTRGKHRQHSHSDEFGPTDWQGEHPRYQRQQPQLPQQRTQQQQSEHTAHPAHDPRMSYSTAEGGTEETEGSETGRHRKRGGSRRRKRDNHEEAATVYAFPRAPQSIFPKLPNPTDNPHELPQTQTQHRHP